MIMSEVTIKSKDKNYLLDITYIYTVQCTGGMSREAILLIKVDLNMLQLIYILQRNKALDQYIWILVDDNVEGYNTFRK